jgi:hypothetical protein
MYWTVTRSLQARLAPVIPEPIMEYLALAGGPDVVWWSGERQRWGLPVHICWILVWKANMYLIGVIVEYQERLRRIR